MKIIEFFLFLFLIMAFFSNSLSAQESADSSSDSITKKDVNWPATIVFKSAANAAYAEPYIIQKKKIMLDLEEKELGFKNRYFDIREKLEIELAKKKPSKTNIIKLTTSLYEIQMEAEQARIDTKKKIIEVDQQMLSDLTDKIDIWINTLKPAKSQKYINYLEKLKE